MECLVLLLLLPILRELFFNPKGITHPLPLRVMTPSRALLRSFAYTFFPSLLAVVVENLPVSDPAIEGA